MPAAETTANSHGVSGSIRKSSAQASAGRPPAAASLPPASLQAAHPGRCRQAAQRRCLPTPGAPAAHPPRRRLARVAPSGNHTLLPSNHTSSAPAPGGPEPSYSFWSVKRYRKFFNVDTQVGCLLVLAALMGLMLFWCWFWCWCWCWRCWPLW
jgi:hypothetical protein